MSEYTPTTDEVDTGYTTFAWELARSSPGEYPDDANFTDYHEVCAAFRRWLAEHDRQVAEKAWDEGKRAEELGWTHVYSGHPVPEGDMCDECEVVNPYRQEGQK